MAKKLTVAAIEKYRGGTKRREIADTQCSGLHLVIQPKTGAKSWALRFRRPGGTPCKLTLGPWSEDDVDGEPIIGQPLSLAAARVLGAKINRERAAGHDPISNHKAELRRQVAKTAAEANVFSQAAHEYIWTARRTKIAKGISRGRGWRDTASILGLRYPAEGDQYELIKGGLAERWQDKPVLEIDSNDVFVVIREARNKGIPGRVTRTSEPSEARAREMAAALSGFFRWLHGERRIATNPCSGLPRPAQPLARKRVLNSRLDTRGADELRWFWMASGKLDPVFGGFARMLLLTGQRRSEVSGMRIEELNDHYSTWVIPGERTKNGRAHSVFLPPLARDILAKNIGDRKSGFVFTTREGTHVKGYAKIKQKLDEEMLKAARKDDPEATIQPWTLHDLRRTAVTGMVEIGIAPHVVEAVVNHVSGVRAGVAGVYNLSELPKPRQDALLLWSQHIERVASGERGKVVPIRKPA